MKMTPDQYLALHRPKKNGRFPVSAPEHRTVDGQLFASKKEASRYTDLKILERRGEIFDLEPQPKFDIIVFGKRCGRYTADFRYKNADGSTVIEDVKSSGTAKEAGFRFKKKIVEALFDIEITVVV